MNQTKAHAVLQQLNGQKMYYYPQKMDSKLRHHFETVGKSAFAIYDFDSTIARDLSWNRVVKRLSMVKGEKQKNSGVRLLFRWKITFLVKKYFTFGLKYVEEDKNHIYETSDVPFIFYHLVDKETSNIYKHML